MTVSDGVPAASYVRVGRDDQLEGLGVRRQTEDIDRAGRDVAMPDEIPAVGYARISRDDQLEGLGVGRQTEDIDRTAERLKARMVEPVIIDNDISASDYSNKVRKGYQRVLDHIRLGRVRLVIVYNLDRLLRSPMELEILIRLVREMPELRVVTVTGDLDLTTDDGQMIARFQVTMAAKEAANTSRRKKRQHDQLAKKGAPHALGRARAFGYGCSHRHPVEACPREDPSKCRSHCDVSDCPHDPLVLIPREAELYRQAVVDVLERGASVTDICRRWMELGVRGPQGAVIWKESTVRNLLANPKHAGRRVHRGEDIGPAIWPAIISYEQHRAIRRLLIDRARKTGPRGPRSAFAGLIVSPEGRRLVRSQRRGRPVWNTRPKFPGETGYMWVAMKAEYLESHILEMFFAAVEGPDLAKRVKARRSRKTTPLPTEDPAEIERQMVELSEDRGAGLITRAEWLAQREKLAARLEAATAAAGDADPVTAPLGDVTNLRERWAELTADQQRSYLTAVFEAIVLHPEPDRRRGPHAPPNLDRIEPRWRL